MCCIIQSRVLFCETYCIYAYVHTYKHIIYTYIHTYKHIIYTYIYIYIYLQQVINKLKKINNKIKIQVLKIIVFYELIKKLCSKFNL